MHALKSALHADKFATFWMFPKKFYHSFVLQMTLLYTLEAAERKYSCDSKTNENACIRVKRNAELSCNF